jgi:error-prone DNA polymerase
MHERTIIQWDKNDLDTLGFIKVDILGLGILTCIRKCFEYLREVEGISLDLAKVGETNDPKVYDAICRGDTIGVFQIESRAQMNMLPRLLPLNFYDLVVEISLVRPGPIQGDMVHPYLRRRSGKEKVEYPLPELEAILKKTFGVPLFQEQIMKMAMAVAGFSAGEADELRRAMGTWRRTGSISSMGEKFRQGLIARGIDQAFADRIFHQIEGFAEYGFPESHAASFALLAYATAYLKYHHPGAYLTALLNAQPMGFYSAQTLIYDGLRHGVKVHPIDINHSDWDNRLDHPMEVRMGFRQVKGFPERTGRAIQATRAGKNFSGLEDLVDRLQAGLVPFPLTKRELFGLAGAHALSSLGLDRRQALWEIQALTLPDSHFTAAADAPTALPHEQRWETIALDYETQGLSLVEHPMAFLRPELRSRGVVGSRDLRRLRTGQKTQVAGIVICRQMPETASGVLFITLEDEDGFTNLVVWRKVFEKFRVPLLTHSFLLCQGKVERAEDTEVIHIIVDAVVPLLETSPTLPSHDFR